MNKKIILLSVLGAVGVGLIVASVFLKDVFPQRAGESAPEGEMKQIAPGSSSVSGSGKVVTGTGIETKTDLPANSPGAPQASLPLSFEEAKKVEREAPGTVVKLTSTLSKITPSSFEVKKGEVVTLIVTSNDRFAHSIYFKDKSLQAISFGIGSGQTKTISFNAPQKAGEYVFACGIPGHESRGETGKMIVR